MPATPFSLLCLTMGVASLSWPNPLPPTTRQSVVRPAPRDTTVVIRAITGLQFSLPRFAVAPGSKVTLVLQNADDMAHNLVVTQPGARLEVVTAALALADRGAALDYVPAAAPVLWHTRVLDPGKSGTITFTVPDQEAVYPYVCTYPGHGYVMYGAMYVTNQPLPPLDKDPNVSPNRPLASTHAAHAVSPHPYPVTFPTLYRTFMPECGPAAIAVGLPGQQSYCWDAGTCRLRYAWKGGFVDNVDHWNGKGTVMSKVMGDVYYRDQSGFPLRVGNAEKLPTTQFKGYQLINRYPQFEYTIDGVAVKELIKPLPDGSGLTREFRIEPASKEIYFVTKPGDGVTYRSSAGKFTQSVLRISPDKAKHFTVTMTAQKGALLGAK